MTYGIKVQPTSDPYVGLAEEAARVAAPLLVAGSFLVDVIPWMKYIPEWFPGAKFQRTARTMREHANAIRNKPFRASQQLVSSGNFDSAFVTEALQELDQAEDPRQEIEDLKDIAGQVFMAGADTTASVLGTFFLVMCRYPEVQKKAQAELDRVLGGRLPEHSDFASLPYLTALVQELYRSVGIFQPSSFLTLNGI
jgi:cytochrome P450